MVGGGAGETVSCQCKAATIVQDISYLWRYSPAPNTTVMPSGTVIAIRGQRRVSIAAR